MNIPKEAIERAIAGGWGKSRLDQLPNWKVASRTTIMFWKELPLVGNHKTVPKERQILQMSSIALDPTFWQALGKALGWGESTFHQIANGIEYQEYGYDEVWRLLAHRFYDLILQGKPTEDFWKELLV